MSKKGTVVDIKVGLVPTWTPTTFIPGHGSVSKERYVCVVCQRNCQVEIPTSDDPVDICPDGKGGSL